MQPLPKHMEEKNKHTQNGKTPIYHVNMDRNRLGLSEEQAKRWQVVFNETIKSDEYKRYCEIYKVTEPAKEKEVGMFLIWKSFGCSI